MITATAPKRWRECCDICDKGTPKDTSVPRYWFLRIGNFRKKLGVCRDCAKMLSDRLIENLAKDHKPDDSELPGKGRFCSITTMSLVGTNKGLSTNLKAKQ